MRQQTNGKPQDSSDKHKIKRISQVSKTKKTTSSPQTSKVHGDSTEQTCTQACSHNATTSPATRIEGQAQVRKT
eukprot:5776120-Amphidinium_carterae.7